MEEFRVKIQKRNCYLRIGIAIAFILNGVLYWFQEEVPQFEMAVSFQMGTLLGLGFLQMMFMMRYSLALKSEDKLRKLYIEEYDERKAMIKQKMAQSAIWTSFIVLLIIGGAMAYVNQMIAITLIGSSIFIIVVMCLFKFYYLHKY